MHNQGFPRGGGDLAGIRFFSIISKGSSEEISVFQLLSWEPKGGGFTYPSSRLCIWAKDTKKVFNSIKHHFIELGARHLAAA